MSLGDIQLREKITGFILDLRMGGQDKKIDKNLYDGVISHIRRFKSENASRPEILKADAGILFYLFESLLSEALHAKEPEPLNECAWAVSEEIRLVLKDSEG